MQPSTKATDSSTTFGSVKEKFFGQEKPQEESIIPSFILNKLEDRSDYPKALIAFASAALFLMLSLFSLPTIVFSPQRFTMLFTITMVSVIVGLFFLNGPKTQLRKMTSGDKSKLVASGVLIASMIMSFYFSAIGESYLMSLLCCFVEFNAVLLFFCNTFPMGSLPFLSAFLSH